MEENLDGEKVENIEGESNNKSKKGGNSLPKGYLNLQINTEYVKNVKQH